MYKVMLVDDEDMEREGMAAIIPWEKLDMQLIDTAWNGVEGLEKIQMQKPDIVITDIKMPVMDGIELIRRCREVLPGIMFVVLSGYGEFDYTSRAMEQGVKYYVLKPCDEEKMVETLTKAVKDLDQQRQKQSKVKEYRSTLERMMPRAKEQILREMIYKKELSPSDRFLLKQMIGEQEDDWIMLAVSIGGDFDQLDRFTLTNIMTELLGQTKICMSAWLEEETVYLIQGSMEEVLRPLSSKVQREFSKYKDVKLVFARSQRGALGDVWKMYDQVRELFALGEEQDVLLSPGMNAFSGEDGKRLVDYGRIREADCYEELLFEWYSVYLKMQVKGAGLGQIREYFGHVLKVLYGVESLMDKKETEGITVTGILKETADICAGEKKIEGPEDKNQLRFRSLLLHIYEHIQDPELSLQYLAKEVMFMNEDYLGRFILRCTGEKYSSFLLHLRMELAKRLLEYFTDIKVADLAMAVGYPPDGQYFTRVFKKYTGMPPSEYKNVGNSEKE